MPALAPHFPINMIACGGYVSLVYHTLFVRNISVLTPSSRRLHNRTSTGDLDYFLSPSEFGADRNAVDAALKSAINSVSVGLEYHEKWCNDDVALFLTLLGDPTALFARSVQQNELLFAGRHILVYAVLWEWVFVRKLKRLQMEEQRPRTEDWLDCLAILHILVDRYPSPLNQSVLTQFDDTDREPPVFSDTIESINMAYRQQFDVDAFAPASN